MPTQKQREANLRNAQLSSGPKTPEGKAASSQNSFRHGIFASDLTLLDDPETATEIEAKLTEYVSYFQPATPLERDLIEEIVLLDLRKRRVARAETGLLNDARSKLFESDTFQDTDGTLFARYDMPSPNQPASAASPPCTSEPPGTRSPKLSTGCPATKLVSRHRSTKSDTSWLTSSPPAPQPPH